MHSAPKLLIFIVAYNAERHIQRVLERIPRVDLKKYDYEILIIDDQSSDNTYALAKEYQKAQPDLVITVLYNPENQGYGGNQKLGYHYAALHHFDIVLLLHGDGQYAPEEFDRLVTPILMGQADAVFGSRMMNKRDALKGKMPYYKLIGNIVLTKVQNYILNTSLSEFHSGYRAYKVKTLNALPIERNSNDFHFDTQIIIQLLIANQRILEVPIPTHYGDEVCYVNGFKYAYNILKASIQSRLVKMGIFYKREYDLIFPEEKLKIEYSSSHSFVQSHIPAQSYILELGANSSLFVKYLKDFGHKVDGLGSQINKPDTASYDNYYLQDLSLPEWKYNLDKYDCILLVDCLEHFSTPEIVLDQIRKSLKRNTPKIILTSPNIGFIISRFQLLIGEFNYSRRGILDFDHKRLFTFKSIKKLLTQSGYNIQKIYGIPAPFPLAFGLSTGSKILVKINGFLIRIWRNLFAYQIGIIAYPKPTVSALLEKSYNK